MYGYVGKVNMDCNSPEFLTETTEDSLKETEKYLAERQIKLSELAYGTEKAKMLFRDMMQQASFDFGFEADDLPLMIEAIPSSSDSITLIITKVEDPEELDTRFPSLHLPEILIH